MDSELRTPDGATLHLRDWRCDGARGTVAIVHGLGEHIGRYEAVAAELNAAGWRATGHDHRGHGRSSGPRGALPDAETLLRDLGQVLAHRRAAWPGPLVLLGHSMGGLVASRFVAEGLQPVPAAWHRPVDALALSSPALAADLSPVQRLLMAVAGRLAPSLAVANGLPLDSLSRDDAVVRAYLADPLVHDRITPRLARFIVDGGELVRALAPRWQVPTLLLWGAADRIVPPRGSEAFAAAAPPHLVTARGFPALVHELFNEPERAEVFAALRAWLAAR